MQIPKFAFLALALTIARPNTAKAQAAGISTWSVQANSAQWNQSLGVTASRQGCSSSPASCIQFIEGVEQSQHVNISLAIPLNSSTPNNAAVYSQLSLSAPYLSEIGIDDFHDQYLALFSQSGVNPAALLSSVITNLKSANPNLKFGATVYEDDLSSTYLQDPRLPASLRAQFDIVHLFIHYRSHGPGYSAYLQQTGQLFPNAAVIAGAYAYDRRVYLPCAPSGPACTAEQDIDLFQQTIAVQAQLWRRGAVAGIEFFPGYFGTEEQWTGWSDPRTCAPGDTAECIANTKNMRNAALSILTNAAPVQAWTRLAPSGAPPSPRSGQSAAIDPASRRAIVFGGNSDSTSLNDTWILATSNGQSSWTPLAASNAPPAGPYSVGMYDPASNRMILYGGPGGSDVWVLSNASGLDSGSPSWILLQPAGAPPLAFSDSETQVYDAARNVMIVFDSSNAVWTLSHANGLGGEPVWTQLAISGPSPSSRNRFTAVYSASSNRMIVFGGNSGGADRNDVWILTHANGLDGTPLWINLLQAGAAIGPTPRSGHLAVYDAGRDAMTIFSGAGQPADTWILSNASGVSGKSIWTMLNPGLQGPVSGANAAAVLDTTTSTMILFGGQVVWTLGPVWDWWPDPRNHHGLAAWVAYSENYDASWSNASFVDQSVAAISQSGVEVVYVALSSAAATPHLQALSDRHDPITMNVQYLLNGLMQQGIRACAAIFSDDFTGSSTQMAKYTLVDNLLAFNASRGPNDTAFTCVGTDLEMQAGFRTAAVYDLWKQFHADLRARITAGGGGLRLTPWIQGPDLLIANMDSAKDQSGLMAREGITQNATDSSLYDGALTYFTTEAGQPIFDAAIPMWYFTNPASFYARVTHSVAELQALGVPDLYLVAGMMIQSSTSGTCCPGCVQGRQDFDARLSFDDNVRAQYPSFIGTAVFLWPIPSNWSCN